jgi:hypothetical protein
VNIWHLDDIPDGLKEFFEPVPQIGLESSPSIYLDKMVAVFREVRRVLHPSGVLLCNMGDGYASTGGHTNEGGPSSCRNGRSNLVAQNAVHGVSGNGLKPKDMLGMPWRLALRLQDDGWWLRSAIVWCLSGGVRLYAKTAAGVAPVLLKDLVRLKPESVQLWTGSKWSKVKAWYPTSPGRSDMREIELASGERIGCTNSHVWPTEYGLRRTDELQVGDIIRRTVLPDTDVIGPRALPQSIAWIVGFYIAEGCDTGDGLRFSMGRQDEKFIADIRRFAEYYGGTLAARNYGNSIQATVAGRLARQAVLAYVTGHNAQGKRLTTAAWNRNNEFLRDVLRGYLDGDGGYDEKNDRWRLGFCNNEYLAADLRCLCARLGYPLSLRRCVHTCQGRPFAGYRGDLRFGSPDHWNAKPKGMVVSIGNSRARKFYDVEIEDEPHLFALASGVMTHNSKPSPMPESCRDRCTKSHEYIFHLAKSDRYFWDAEAIAEPTDMDKQWSGHSEKKYGSGGTGLAPRGGLQPIISTSRNCRDVWTLAPQPCNWEFCGACKTLLVGTERKRIGVKDNVRTCPTCKATDKWVAHFAAFPESLPERCIKAGSSERGCCPKCGAPWERVTEREQLTRERPNDFVKRFGKKGTGNSCANSVAGVAVTTTGWRATCSCQEAETVPATILDCFCGTATTIIVATRLGRKAIGIELSPTYFAAAQARIQREIDLKNGTTGPLMRAAKENA